MLDAREPLPVGSDRTGFRIHSDQSTVPDERHAGAAHQTASELDKPGTDWRPEGGQGRIDPGAPFRHTLHPHSVPAKAQDHRGNGLSDIFRNTGVDPGE